MGKLKVRYSFAFIIFLASEICCKKPHLSKQFEIVLWHTEFRESLPTLWYQGRLYMKPLLMFFFFFLHWLIKQTTFISAEYVFFLEFSSKSEICLLKELSVFTVVTDIIDEHVWNIMRFSTQLFLRNVMPFLGKSNLLFLSIFKSNFSLHVSVSLFSLVFSHLCMNLFLEAMKCIFYHSALKIKYFFKSQMKISLVCWNKLK